MTTQNSSTGTQVLLVLACLVIVIAGLKAASSIVIPLLMAIFLAIIASTPLQWLRRRGLPTWAALTLILLLLGSALISIGSLIGASIDQLSNTLPRYEAQLRALIDNVTLWASGLGLTLPPSGLEELIDPAAAAQLFGRLVSGFGGLLANSMLIIFTVLFLMVESATIPDKLRAISADPDKTIGNLSAFMESVNSYLVIKALMSFITALAITVYLLVLGVDFAVLWGAFAFFMNFVPYIGSIIAAVPAVTLSLIDAGPAIALAVGAGFLVANIVVGSLLEPRYMGRGLGLSTLVVFVSLLFWGWVFGPVGMFLSTPLTMLVKIALESDPRSRWISVLLSAQAPGKSSRIS
ncbi:MAG TPA: AI-2E family transporter [Gammaproteobacteria bacterium]|nr:AI-2E family transporter [Gammaproteobacteria bacterium]